MLSNSPILPSQSKSNSNHIHILCPYKFCTCFCTLCNSSISVCSCICHSDNQKTKVNNLSIGKENNNIHHNKTILSNYSTNMYQKTKKYLHYGDSSLSQSNDLKRDISSNDEYSTKKIFFDKLYKNIGNYNGRSLSEINIKKNNTENNRKPGLYRKENYLN